MGGFIVFVIILIVIWTLSGIANWVSKQQEQERRRRLREQMARAGLAPPETLTAQRPPSRRRPSADAPAAGFRGAAGPQQSARRTSPQRPPQVPAQRAQAAPQKQKQRGRRQQATPLPPPPLPTLAFADQQVAAPMPPSPILQPISPARPARATGGRRADAPSLSRWLQPGTLRQQFILTEIFQPPLALREQQRSGV